MVLMILALACTPDPAKDAADSADTGPEVVDDTGGSDNGGNGDSGSERNCNTANEECGPDVRGCNGEGGEMLPGADCIACHSEGNAEDPREMGLWSIAGTAFTDIDGTGPLQGAVIRVTDATGAEISLNSNRAGNFYTERTITFPITATITSGGQTREMSQEVETGACNSCHTCDGEANGKLYGD